MNDKTISLILAAIFLICLAIFGRIAGYAAVFTGMFIVSYAMIMRKTPFRDFNAKDFIFLGIAFVILIVLARNLEDIEIFSAGMIGALVLFFFVVLVNYVRVIKKDEYALRQGYIAGKMGFAMFGVILSVVSLGLFVWFVLSPPSRAPGQIILAFRIGFLLVVISGIIYTLLIKRSMKEYKKIRRK